MTSQVLLAKSSTRGERLLKRFRESAKWYPFILVNLFVFIVFNLISWIYLVHLSLHRKGLLLPAKFVGLDNFVSMISDDTLHITFKNTLAYALMYVPAVSVVSFLIALALNRRLIGRRFYSTAYFLPVITSVSVLAAVWWWLFSPRPDGPVNYVIGLLGIGAQDWLVDLRMALPTVVGMSLWATFGYYAVIWLAGIQGVPKALYEAARIDGAEGWRLHWHISLPMLRPTAAFIVTIATMNALQIFGEIYILTGGGPVHRTETMAYYAWSQAFLLDKQGYASAVTILLFSLILFVTIVQNRLMRASEGLY